MRRTVARLLLRAHPVQALAEAWLAGSGVLALLLWLQADLQPNGVFQGCLFLSAGAALWCALRIRLPHHTRRWRLVVADVGPAVVLSLLLAATWGMALDTFWVPPPAAADMWLVVLLLLATGPEYLVLRVGIRGWDVWSALRRRHLVWSLTHLQVQVVALFATVYVVLLTILLFVEGYLPSQAAQESGILAVVSSLVFTFLPLLGVTLAATAFLLAVVLPPTALFSYLLSRRTTRRLQALTGAAARLRGGDYQARVEVDGEDEVAQLQADFNAMAADLERAMGELAQERDRVASLLSSQRALTATVSHELRTPVATVRAYLESGRATWGAGLSAGGQRDLQVVENEIARLHLLIDDLFTLARAEAGGLKLEVGAVDAGALIRRRVQALAPLAWQSGRVEVVADVPASLPRALADEARLEQVLGNLLRNAVRHTLPGGIVIVTASQEDGRVRIEVRDTGEGIPPEELPHIWERFYRGERRLESLPAGAEAKSGAGLGLALVKDLTEAMAGTVAVESSLGQGTCFAVSLPCAST
ncbi:MAG TPA: HAMP domain-containing sensor histidine kinase [Anaerolineae bacterium]|nr:HAMP domain-containing sensor histidine kinase [Anaerolineae bacterium]